METDAYTLVSEDGRSSSGVSSMSALTNQTFANLAKNINGEQSNYGFAMVLQFLRNFKGKFINQEDEDRAFYIEYFCDLMRAKKRADFSLDFFRKMLEEMVEQAKKEK